MNDLHRINLNSSSPRQQLVSTEKNPQVGPQKEAELSGDLDNSPKKYILKAKLLEKYISPI